MHFILYVTDIFCTGVPGHCRSTAFKRHSMARGTGLDLSWDTGISLTLRNLFLSLLFPGAEVSPPSSLQTVSLDRLCSCTFVFKSKINSILMQTNICFYVFLGQQASRKNGDADDSYVWSYSHIGRKWRRVSLYFLTIELQLLFNYSVVSLAVSMDYKIFCSSGPSNLM